MRPPSMATSSRTSRPGSPGLESKTPPRARIRVWLKEASTGSRSVLPFVASTTAWYRVVRCTGWPPASTVKSGVSVRPSTEMRDSDPPNVPSEDSLPEMPLNTLRLALANVKSPSRGVAPGTSAFQGPKWPRRTSICPGGTALVTDASNGIVRCPTDAMCSVWIVQTFGP